MCSALGWALETLCVHAQSLESCSTLGDLMDCNHQATLSTEFSPQEYWSGWPFPPSEDLPHSGIEPASPVSPALAGRFFTTEPPGKPTGDPRMLRTLSAPLTFMQMLNWFMMYLQHGIRAGFLSLTITDTLGWIILCYEGLPCELEDV